MIDFKGIFNELLQIKGDLILPFILSSLIVIISLVILAIRYKVILDFLNEKLSFFDSFNILNLTQFVSSISPFRVGALITKPVITKTISKISFKKSVLASVFEQAYDISWQICILPFLILILGQTYIYKNTFLAIIIILLIIIILIFAINNPEKVVKIIWPIKSLLPRILINYTKKKNISKKRIMEIIDKSKKYLHNKKMITYITLITSIHFILSAMILQIFIAHFGYNINYFFIISSFWASAIIGRLSGIPLGLGVRDVSLGAILVSLGVIVVDSIKIVLFVRLVLILVLTILGLFFFIYDSIRIKGFKTILKRRNANK